MLKCVILSLVLVAKLVEMSPINTQTYTYEQHIGSSITVSGDQDVVIGSSVTLLCKASTNVIPRNTVVWMEGGVAVNPVEGKIAIEAKGQLQSEMVIYDVDYSDLGEYTCFLEIQWNETINATTQITLQGKSYVHYIRVAHNGNQDVTCSSCLMTEKNLASGIITQFNMQQPLKTFKLTSLANQTKVVCHSHNSDKINITYILADYKPIKFVSPSTNNSIIRGVDSRSIRVDCIAVGEPQPNISWTKNEKRLSIFLFILVKGTNSLTFKIPSFSQYYLGEYGCKAKNIWETKTQTVRISGQRTPQPLLACNEDFFNVSNFTASSNELLSGQTLHLRCKISLPIEVFKNKVHGIITNIASGVRGRQTAIAWGNSRTIVRRIENVTMADSGVYSCIAYSFTLNYYCRKDIPIRIYTGN